jgi:S1-C subfamily serine protease
MLDKKKIIRNFAIIFVSLLLLFSLSSCSVLVSKLNSLQNSLQNSTTTSKLSVQEANKNTAKNSQNNNVTIDNQILAAFDDAISKVAEEVKPSVVNIKVEVQQQDIFGNIRQGEGVGSGVILTSDGYIITNNHVAGDAKSISVTLYDGKEYPAKLIGADSNTDIAVVKIEANNLKPASFASIKNIKVGQLAIALGSPFGLQQTVTQGVVSAIGRDVLVSTDSLPLVDLIQTDAAINPGNSGGPLVNSSGQVMGINTMIFSTSGSNSGVGFAIPSDTALNIANQIIKYGKARIPFIGIEMGTNNTDVKGVYVKSVVSGAPAQKAGIKQGDIIIEFDNEKIESPYQLLAAILRHNVGDNVNIKVSRNGQTLSFNLTLVESKQQ